eukprot:CAMPEP_0181216722 /NCGR_PEP_ID=MMETSP1096-20121128/26750_1 /TAXON_ID=156174 ORGANISM="Chrysochromulina ericina, Strain CCMP281" /NCGR_SAMPLE_ID=MMETSP1096 /ASSEMBLY_ACC=CAM_ASM_000453 /LENGTH=73 /DNA_ID=CAMNT_0023308767 /DNA_START=32 /DNA_END=253 /DNA_ORIENTATION=-
MARVCCAEEGSSVTKKCSHTFAASLPRIEDHTPLAPPVPGDDLARMLDQTRPGSTKKQARPRIDPGQGAALRT